MDEIIAACMSYEGSLGDTEDFPVSDVPVWILGKQYSTETQLEELRSDVLTRIWMTYRKNFPLISGTTFSSDKGWGCTLRCGQMVLAESLLRYHFGREWRWTPEEESKTYLRIISLFEDDRKQPFSIHQMAQTGVEIGKNVGDWHGPNTTAQVLKKLTQFDHWNHFSISIPMDAFIMDEIRESAQDLKNKCFRPLLICIPLRLGADEINPVYISGIKKFLKMPQSLGIIGGRPNHAIYIIGYMGEEIVYLDPHTTQEAGKLGDKKCSEAKEIDNTYHCGHAQRIPFEYLDPSMSLCFFCTSEKEFGDLCNRLQQDIIDGESSPMFELYTTRPPALTYTEGFETAVESKVRLRDLGPKDLEYDFLGLDVDDDVIRLSTDEDEVESLGVELEDHHLDSDDDEEFEILE